MKAELKVIIDEGTNLHSTYACQGSDKEREILLRFLLSELEILKQGLIGDLERINPVTKFVKKE